MSTRIGAEGLATEDGDICRLADDPEDFARKIIELFDAPETAAELAGRAREYVVRERDMRVMTGKLERSYRKAILEKASTERAGN